MIPKILGSPEISTGMSAIFEILELWVKKFSKIAHLQKCQKTSFFNICCFFVVFWAKWAKLPIFAQFCLPEISRGLGGTLSKFEKSKKINIT